jgi:hypothetical protein
MQVLPLAQRSYSVEITSARAPAMILYDFTEAVNQVMLESQSVSLESGNLILKSRPSLPDHVSAQNPERIFVAVGDPEAVQQSSI